MSAPDAATRVALAQKLEQAISDSWVGTLGRCRWCQCAQFHAPDCLTHDMREAARLLRLSAEREEKLADAIVALRESLSYYATDDEGWMEIEHAHAYEQSKALVPIRSDESGAEVSPVKEP